MSMSIDAVKKVRPFLPTSMTGSQGAGQQQSVSDQLQNTDIFSYAKIHGSDNNQNSFSDINNQQRDSLVGQNVGAVIGNPYQLGMQGIPVDSQNNNNIQNNAKSGIDVGQGSPTNAFAINRSSNADNISSSAAQTNIGINSIQQQPTDGVTNPNNTNNPGKQEDFQGNNSTSVYSSVFKKQIRTHNLFMMS